jgi:hypothetical protein
VRVQRVVMPVTGAVSWTVVDDWTPVVAAERYLAHLAGSSRSVMLSRLALPAAGRR